MEYLLACNDGDWTLGYSQWSDVFHPNSMEYERLPGIEYRLRVVGVPVFFAEEMPGIQVCVEGEIPEEVGRQLVTEVLANLERVTGQRGRIVEL